MKDYKNNQRRDYTEEEILLICSNAGSVEIAQELGVSRKVIKAQRALMLFSPQKYIDLVISAGLKPGQWLINNLPAAEHIKDFDIEKVKYWHYIIVNPLLEGSLSNSDDSFVKGIKMYNANDLYSIQVKTYCRIKNIATMAINKKTNAILVGLPIPKS